MKKWAKWLIEIEIEEMNGWEGRQKLVKNKKGSSKKCNSMQ